jgi:hypothetical protein
MLNTLPIRAVEMNLAVYWKTFMKPFVTHSLCSGGHCAPEAQQATARQEKCDRQYRYSDCAGHERVRQIYHRRSVSRRV